MRTKDQSLLNEVKKFAEEYFLNYRKSPTVRTIGEALGISTMTAQRYITELKNNGILCYKDGNLLTTACLKYSHESEKAAIVGSIPCGPTETEEENVEEYVDLPKAIFGDGPFYILSADGNSMINAGIDDGDLVVIRKQDTARKGDIVVALVNDNESTLKRYYIDEVRHKVILHPENPEYEDMEFDSIVIQGIAVNVIKALL